MVMQIFDKFKKAITPSNQSTPVLEVIDKLKHKLTFNIDKSIVESSVKTELTKYSKNAKADGFRKGKIPLNILEKMYGGQAYEDALNKQIQKNFGELITEHKLNLVDYPEFKLLKTTDTQFAMEATFEIMPVVSFQNLNTIEVNEPKCEFQDKYIDQTIDIIRKQQSNFITIPDKIIANDDKVLVDFVGTIDNKEFVGSSANDYSFIIGAKMMLPEFEQAVIGHKSGDQVIATINFPDNYHAAHLQNKQALFTINIKDVAIAQLPEVDEQFIKNIGISDGTVTTLRQEISKSVTFELKRKLKAKTRQNVLDALYKYITFDIPNTLVHNEIHLMIDHAKKQSPNQQQEFTHEMFANEATRMVALRIIMQSFVKEYAITITDEDIKLVLDELAMNQQDPQEYIKKCSGDKQIMNNIRNIAMEHKVIELLLIKMKVTPTEVNYNEIISANI
jgi:trigger factor